MGCLWGEGKGDAKTQGGSGDEKGLVARSACPKPASRRGQRKRQPPTGTQTGRSAPARTCPRAKDNDVPRLQLADRAAPDVGLRDLLHLDGGLDARRDADLLQGGLRRSAGRGEDVGGRAVGLKKACCRLSCAAALYLEQPPSQNKARTCRHSAFMTVASIPT
jgi:hypothetical protein